MEKSHRERLPARGSVWAWPSPLPRRARTSSASARLWNLPAAKQRKKIRATGAIVSHYSCDFSDRKAVHAFIKKLKADVPRIDILVNNAGTIARKPAAEHPDEFWDKTVEVNLECTIHSRPRDRPRHACPRQGQNYFHRVDADVSGRDQCDQLRRQQGRHRQSDQSICQRMGEQGR